MKCNMPNIIEAFLRFFKISPNNKPATTTNVIHSVINTIQQNIRPASQFIKNLPPRNESMMSGTEFYKTLSGMPPNQDRDNLVMQEFLSGNVPNFMRTFTPITVTVGSNTLTYFVSPDVLCIGSDEDFIRSPLNPRTAKKIMDIIHCTLPTKKMSDQIWKSADLKLKPSPNGPPYTIGVMASTDTFVMHNNKIQKQINDKSYKLITGIKKDIIIGKPLVTKRNIVGIYGWHYTNGIAIQGPNPNYSSHNAVYLDYSHGVRLISRDAKLNNETVDIYEILKNPLLSNIISDEGSYDASFIYKI